MTLIGACTPSASTLPSACTQCVEKHCTAQNAACAASPECKAIVDCVDALSPCVGAHADDPQCDDDCIKAACANKHPSGVELYTATQTCEGNAQCGVCLDSCKVLVQKCVVDEACNFDAPTPESCKCTPFDGGIEGGTDARVSGDGQNACGANPTCELASSKDVNGALGTNVGGATTKVIGGPVVLTQCRYGASPGVHIDYWVPYGMSDYLAGRAQVESMLMVTTTTVPNLGDAAFQGAVGTNGVNLLVVLKGCVQFEITAVAAPDQLIALAKAILLKL